MNEKIFEDLPVRTFVTPIDEARKLGAMMLFGEKYGDQVRVVEIDGFSRELCGGTHVRSTAEIGPFAILSEAPSVRERAASRRSPPARRTRYLHGALRGGRGAPRELGAGPEGDAQAAQGDARPISRSSRSDGDVVLVEARVAKGGELRISPIACGSRRRPRGVIVGSVDDGRAYLVVNLDESLVGRDSTRRSSCASSVATSAAAAAGGRRWPRREARIPAGLRDALEAGKQAIAAALK